jgi:hypothetical protein
LIGRNALDERSMKAAMVLGLDDKQLERVAPRPTGVQKIRRNS